MNQHEKINYIEFPSKNIEETKAFFGQLFGWNFVDYGSDYVAFSDAGIDGGFYTSDTTFNTEKGCPLIVFYSNDLESTLDKAKKVGGKINKPIFSFPGGRRFHFCDPHGNEFSVWSDKNI